MRDPTAKRTPPKLVHEARRTTRLRTGSECHRRGPAKRDVPSLRTGIGGVIEVSSTIVRIWVGSNVFHRMRLAVVPLALVAISSCVIGKRSLAMPDNSQTVVALFSGGLGEPMEEIARHPWFAVRKAGETDWRVYQVGGGGVKDGDPSRVGVYVKPILHGLWVGEEGERARKCVEVEGPKAKARIERDYFFPGPNSNTFGDVVLRACKLSASLPSTSVGKDWRGIFGAGITSERTGVQFSTPIVGLKIGLKEGIEIHIIHLAFGIDFWPPAIIVPLGPGRIGFADR